MLWKDESLIYLPLQHNLIRKSRGIVDVKRERLRFIRQYSKLVAQTMQAKFSSASKLICRIKILTRKLAALRKFVGYSHSLLMFFCNISGVAGSAFFTTRTTISSRTMFSILITVLRQAVNGTVVNWAKALNFIIFNIQNDVVFFRLSSIESKPSQRTTYYNVSAFPNGKMIHTVISIGNFDREAVASQ